MLLIGSAALACFVDGIRPNDLDLVGSYEEAVAFRKKFNAKSFYPINGGASIKMTNPDGFICEFEITWPDSKAEKLVQFMDTHGETMYTKNMVSGMPAVVPTLDLLYALKQSHKYKKNSPHFHKTMRDIKMFEKMGCFIPARWNEWFEERCRMTYDYGLPKLNVSKEGFFDSKMTGVHQVYDHDTIHEAVALFEQPAYKWYQPDDQEVNCSKEMFWDVNLHNVVRLAGVLEESCVLALERSLIPFPGAKTPEEAFRFALMKVCTSITGGWLREFAWNHHDEVVELFLTEQRKECYTEKFKRGVESGLVKLKEHE